MTVITPRRSTAETSDDVVSWVDSERFEEMLRDARADASLLQELDELLPDTIAEL